MERKTWYGLDLFKFIAAVLIVYMHTYNKDWGAAGNWILNVLSTACVPFFFLVSGFLFRLGIEKNGAGNDKEGEKRWTKHYISRLVRLYITWSILTFPIALMIVDRGHPEYGILMKLVYHLRLFFLTGSIGIYWYVLALILSVIIILFFQKKKCLGLLTVISVLLFLWGCAYNSPTLNRHQAWFEIVHIVFGSERNFLNVGLFFTLMGFLFPAVRIKKRLGILKKLSIPIFVLCLLIRSMEFLLLNTEFTPALVAGSAFLIALSFDFNWISRISLRLRELSIGLYLLHFPIILLFDFYLKKGSLTDFPVTLALSLAVCFIISNYLPELSSILFGYTNRSSK